MLASSQQINFQCPNLPAGTPMDVRVVTESGEILSAPETIMSAAAPTIFTLAKAPGSNTIGAVAQVAATNQLVSTEADGSSAQQGDAVRIYATGLGNVGVSLAPGTAAPLDKVYPLVGTGVTVRLGGQELKPLFAGLAPGAVGVYQLDVVIPSNAQLGAEVPLFIQLDLADGSTRLSNPASLPISAAGNGKKAE